MDAPTRDDQPGRRVLDLLICETAVNALDAILPEEFVSQGEVMRGDKESRVTVQMRGGFEYEVSVRCTRWPSQD